MPIREIPGLIKSFVKNSILGGVAILMPLGILIFTFKWLFEVLTGLFSPVAALIIDNTQFGQFVADLLSIALLLTGCFFIGVFIRTRAGGLLFDIFEEAILFRVPGYSFIKETVSPLLGGKKTVFRQVVIGRPYGDDSKVIGFATEYHEDGSVTMVCPTAPNVTSGLVFVVPADRVEFKDIGPEKAMRSLIACGAGSAEILSAPTIEHPHP